MSAMFVVLCLLAVGVLAMALEAYAIGHDRGDLRPGPVEPKCSLSPVQRASAPHFVPSVKRENTEAKKIRLVAYRSRRHGGNVVGRFLSTDSQGRHHIAVKNRFGEEIVVRRKVIVEVHYL
jgi:hypothetical protein